MGRGAAGGRSGRGNYHYEMSLAEAKKQAAQYAVKQVCELCMRMCLHTIVQVNDSVLILCALVTFVCMWHCCLVCWPRHMLTPELSLKGQCDCLIAPHMHTTRDAQWLTCAMLIRFCALPCIFVLINGADGVVL